MDYTVMIVGSGPAGISTWLHLNRYAPQLSERTLVIDKAIFPRDKLCAGGLSSWATDVLEQLEVELDIPSLLVSDVEFRFEKETYHFHRTNCFKIVQRLDFDFALVKAARDRGLNLHEGEKLINIFRDQNKLIVETCRRRYCVQTIVGADGAFSMVRQKLLPSSKSHFAPMIEIFAPVDSQYEKEFKEKKIVLNFTPIKDGLQGYTWIVPTIKGVAPSVAHGIADFRIFNERPRASMKKIFSHELQTRNVHLNSKCWSSHPVRWLSGEDIISNPNVLLVGDAAGIEPAFGGGIHLALSYGEVAANAIIDAFKNNNYTYDDYRRKLESHIVGLSISESTRLAVDMYGGIINPLKIIRKHFTTEHQRQGLLSLLLSRATDTSNIDSSSLNSRYKPGIAN
jgi:flavin-dependent dehydrogenase